MKWFVSGVWILFVFAGLSFHCIQNRDDLFYSAPEGNQKTFETYALKNSACGTNKLPGALLLGRVKIDDLKLCFRAIELIDCVTWNTEGYVPGSCKAIGTSFK
ncbi:LIC13255 family lipoprotein [Leptospira vanthielii]|uniref:Lipoprotein n=2 Tax=Leptospira vanthielii TaxID=293085 RepID=A0ABY2NML7_9LEPT|nr:hypothetical protein [Leptospira vanthielii]EMY71362.1 hypothetical protein LEP1GSC199_3529 [Leptospira vanthielii serovar Holland str. Waz Holland = ATCC 700522]TGM52429.1 hypothetical protein EHQ95_12265 [Leptospira vanthielii]